MKNNKINCSVFDCEHCNSENEMCKLESIKVQSCNSNESRESTMCASYKRKK